MTSTRTVASFRVVAGLFLTLGPASAVAQSPAERLAIDSLFAELTATITPGALSLATRCEAYTGTLEHLCRGSLATKLGELTESADASILAESELRQVVEAEPDWASGWYALGMARLGLARAGVFARPGPLQTLGVSWEAGAGHALVRALELDSNYVDAATALALGGIPREGKSQMAGRMAMLRRVRPLLGPVAKLGAARVERVAGSRDSAAVLFEQVLASGVIDSGFVAPELARELYASGQPEAGRRVLFANAGTTSDEGRAAYRRELEWVAEPGELVAWDSTPSAARPAWLQQFWAVRDVTEGWPDGTRLVEHYRRIEAAWQSFTLALPPSGRHKMSTTTGGIDTFVDALLERQLNGSDGVSLAMGTEDPAVSQALGLVEQLRAIGLDGPFRAFRTHQDVLDDRGIVWIRFGKPDKMVVSVGGEQMQVWVYDRVAPRLVLQFREENFDGQAGATRLVPTLIDAPTRFRDQFCGVEQSLCAVDTSAPEIRGGRVRLSDLERYARQRSDGGRLTVAVVDRLLREGRQQIDRGTTDDANPRVFTSKLDPVVQLYGLMTPGQERSVALAVFALPGEQLAWTQPAAANGRTVYPVRIHLSMLAADGHRVDVDSLNLFATAKPLEAGQYLSGTLAVPLPAGSYRGSLLISQSDGRGAVATLPGIGVPGAAGGLELSSIVLGREGSGVAWRVGPNVIALNPLGAYPEKATAEMYYQVQGQRPGAKYRTTLEFMRADKPDESALTLQFDDEARSAFREVKRSIGLANLRPGRYRLRVTISGDGANATESAWLTVAERD